MAASVKLRVRGLRRLQREAARSSNSKPIDTMLKQWGKRYLAFTKRRFQKQSGGGGVWPDLAESTKRQRRGSGQYKILQDKLRSLVKALTIGAPGNLFDIKRGRIRVGFGGPARHPDGFATIADIARFHQTGKGHLPKREIIVEPDAGTVRGMNRDTQKALKKLVAMGKQ